MKLVLAALSLLALSSPSIAQELPTLTAKSGSYSLVKPDAPNFEFLGLKSGMTEQQVEAALSDYSRDKEYVAEQHVCFDIAGKVDVKNMSYVSSIWFSREASQYNDASQVDFTSHQLGHGVKSWVIERTYKNPADFKSLVKEITDKIGPYSQTQNYNKGVRANWYWVDGKPVKDNGNKKYANFEVNFVGSDGGVSKVYFRFVQMTGDIERKVATANSEDVCEAGKKMLEKSGSGPLRLP